MDKLNSVQHWTSRSPEETEELGEAFARSLGPGAVVGLYGDLGAGKTCFVRGMARGVGATRAVTSPTFALVHEYPGTVPLCHLDLYRIQSPGELEDIGWEDYVYGGNIAVIEWAEKAAGLMPASSWRIYFDSPSQAPGLPGDEVNACSVPLRAGGQVDGAPAMLEKRMAGVGPTGLPVGLQLPAESERQLTVVPPGLKP